MRVEADHELEEGFGERWVLGLRAGLLDTADRLGDLDRRAGDGDFGTNITTAMGLLGATLEAGRPEGYRAWVTAVSRAFLGVGGTSGPLFGMFFRDLARCAIGAEPTLAELAAGFAAGLVTVQRYGGAEVGHKTMVDALEPGAHPLAAAAAVGEPAPAALDVAARAATTGARSTADLVARRGRASYVGEVARGVMDPGAAAVAIILLAAVSAARGTTELRAVDWLA